MMIVPPDPPAAEEAELRSEDDGMPVHPAKSQDAADYADTHAERERRAAAGYPLTPAGRAYANAKHGASKIIDELLAPKNRAAVAVAGALGLLVAALLLERSYSQANPVRRGRIRW